MKKRIVTRKNLIVLAAVLMLLSTILTACSSNAKTSTKEETAKVEEKTEVVKVDVAESTPEPTLEPAPKPTAEPTPEPTSEPIVYKGIDMESTLPGKEWMATFEGIITEPKLVVFNDSTNKKVIIEEGQEVEFSISGDTLGVYVPREKGSIFDTDYNIFNNSVDDGTIGILKEVSGEYKVGDTVTTRNKIKWNGEKAELTAQLTFIE